ncbi:MAG: YbaB/EbfC family nucleoid-associated protein [Planctomycetota bacterium]|jgi:DNA-binding YbaB/EbfC family protein
MKSGQGGQGGMGGMGDLVKRAQAAQKNMGKIQEYLRDRHIEGSSGGGAVTVFVNGQQELLKIRIKPEVVDPEDVGMLEDLVAAAVRQGLEDSKKLMQEEMGKAMGGVRIPGLF